MGWQKDFLACVKSEVQFLAWTKISTHTHKKKKLGVESLKKYMVSCFKKISELEVISSIKNKNC